MQLPLSECARLAGVSRSALVKAIQRGRLSASKSPANGQWVVDAAELSRVYPLVSSPCPGEDKGVPVLTPGDTLSSMSSDIAHVRELLAVVTQERDWLREQLVAERGERQKLLVLLETRPTPDDTLSAPRPHTSRTRLLIAAVVVLGLVLALVHTLSRGW